MNFKEPTSHLKFRQLGYLHPTSPALAGYRQAPPQTTNHSPTHSVSPTLDLKGGPGDGGVG